MKKRSYCLISSTLLLVACSKPTLEQTTTHTNETLQHMTTELNTLFDAERALMPTYEEALKEDEMLTSFSQQSGILYDNLMDRQSLVESLQSDTKALQQTVDFFTTYDGDKLSSEKVNRLIDQFQSLQTELQAYTDFYLKALTQQTQYFDSFSSEDMDYNHLTYGVDVINDTHKTLYTQAQSIDVLLSSVTDSLNHSISDDPSLPEKTDDNATAPDSKPHEDAPEYVLNPATWAFEPIDDAPAQVALLTIDDAPDGQALEMAHIMKDHHVSGIFFVNGMYLDEEGQSIIKQIYDMGFEIGNHTQTHPNLSQISESEQKTEITETSNLIEEAIGTRPKFFRAPFGVTTDYVQQIVDEEGMLLMNWTYGYDWEPRYQEATELADIMVNAPELNDGANLLMHDRTWTRDALEDIIKGLQAKGYGFIDPKMIQLNKEGHE